MGQQSIKFGDHPPVKTFADEFLESLNQSLEANSLLRRATPADIKSIAKRNPWGWGFDETKEALTKWQAVMQTVHFNRSQTKTRRSQLLRR